MEWIGSARDRIRERFEVVDTLWVAWVEYERDRASYLATAMIYYAIVSLMPLLLLLLAALGLLLRFSAVAQRAEAQILLGIGASVGADLAATVSRLLDTLEQESVVASVVSVGGLLLTASVLFRHLRLSFREIWRYEPAMKARPLHLIVGATILEHVVAFAMIVGGGVLLLVALVLIAAIEWLTHQVNDLPLIAEVAGWLLTALTSWILAAATFAASFTFLPPVRARWRHVWPVALLCALGWVVASELLAFYAAFFGTHRSTSGTVGAVLVVMLWMKVVNQLLFFGAELCKVRATDRRRVSHAP